MVSLGFFRVAGKNDLPFLVTSSDDDVPLATASAASSELCQSCLDLFERDGPTTRSGGGAKAACADACARDDREAAYAAGFERPYASGGQSP
jgi:hypothetical protein